MSATPATPISVGSQLPDVTVRTIVDGAPAVVPASEVLGSGRVVLFAVPGAFTPTCSREHLPSYKERASDLSAAGVDRIVCLGVNDVFVMQAWGEVNGVSETITMVADPDGEFTHAIGMEVDCSAFGMGVRSKRYAMVLEDGVVTAFLPEEDGFSMIASSADCVLKTL
jgi:peroxiredoxin